MAYSNPTILSADIPARAPPNNTFPVNVEVRQDGPDPWASEDWCVQSNLDPRGWKTPVRILVDGEEADSRELCLTPGNTGTAKLSVSGLSPGEHRIRVVVDKVGGNKYDLKKSPHEVNDDVRGTVSVEQNAEDPSRPSTGDKVTGFLRDAADALGGTTQQVALGGALALVLLMVI